MPKIAFDFDDVLFPFTMKFRDHCVNNHNLESFPTKQIKSPNFEHIFTCGRSIAQEIMDNMMYKVEEWDTFHVLSGEEEREMEKIHSHLARIKNMGHELVIITARSEMYNLNLIVNYCRRYFPDIFTDFHFCNSYSEKEIKRTKSEICVQYDVSVLIDDSLHNVNNVRVNSIIGIPFGPHPWTQHEDNIPTWEELVDFVSNLIL